MPNNIEFIVLGNVKDLEKKLQSAKEGFDKLGKASSIALAGLTASAFGFISAAKQQEQSINQLNQSLQNQGRFTQEASKELTDYANALQRVSLFQDDEIVKAEAIISTLGFNIDVTKRLTKATLDLAQAQGIDLASAAQLVTRAIGNDGEVIRGTTVQLEGLAGSTIKAESAISALNKSFGGQAETATKGLGQITVLKNELANLAQDIGNALAPQVLSVTRGLSSMVQIAKENPEIAKFAAQVIILGSAVATTGIAISILGKGLIGLQVSTALLIANLGILIPLVIGAGAAFALWKVDKLVTEIYQLVDANKQLTQGLLSQEEAQKRSLEARGLTLQQVQRDASVRLAALQENQAAQIAHDNKIIESRANVDQFFKDSAEQLKQISATTTQAELSALLLKFEDERAALINNLTLKQQILDANGLLDIQKKIQFEDQIAAINAQYDGIEAQAKEAQQNKLNAFEQKGLETYKKVQADKLGTLESTLQQASSLNKEFAIAYQVFAIGQAIVNTALGVTAALAHFDFVSAALIALSGGIQIATIASQSFAVGTPNVPKDMTAQIHEGETIIPKTFSEGLRDGDLTLSGKGGGSGIVFDFSGAQFNGITDTLVREIFTKASENIANKTLAFRGVA